jgi:hypothetical protein
MREIVTSLADIIELSTNIEKENVSLACNFEIEVDGHTCKVYEASVAHRDILLYSDKGVLNYLVDSYENIHVAECYYVDLEGEQS